MSMKKFIEPKSDQLNADDLISGNRIIKITKVRVTEEKQQACTIWFEGDNGKPWKPSKGMGKIIVFSWTDNPQNYVGKYVEISRDPKVKFGGEEVGGIVIVSLSHIEEDFVFSLTTSKGVRKPFKVRKLIIIDEQTKKAGDEAATLGVDAYVKWRDALAPGMREAVRPHNAEWSKAAKEADALAVDAEKNGG